MIRIGFSFQSNFPFPVTEVIPLLCKEGFSAISPVWSPELDLDAIASCAKHHNMVIQSLHAPHKNISLLWQPDTEESRNVQHNILRTIDACSQYQIPAMVLHGWQGLEYTFPDTPLDFRFFDQMVDHAEEKCVAVAFENLEGEEYLGALMSRYAQLPHIGYCWDSGHDHCYPHKTDFLQAYGSRLIMTHLNDNLGLRDPSGIPSGLDDLHYLPGDGILDWTNALNRLSQCPVQEILNFEPKTRSHSKSPSDLIYSQLSLEQFISLAGSRARKIAAQYAAIIQNTDKDAP